MPQAYLFAEVDVTDQQEFAKYVEEVPATIAAYGGQYVVKGGNAELTEGQAREGTIVVLLEFPSRERLMEWYTSEDYKPLKQQRERSAKTRIWIMTGLDQ
jgi:uncharacterized protein (DUF1330 family)